MVTFSLPLLGSMKEVNLVQPLEKPTREHGGPLTGSPCSF